MVPQSQGTVTSFATYPCHSPATATQGPALLQGHGWVQHTVVLFPREEEGRGQGTNLKRMKTIHWKYLELLLKLRKSFGNGKAAHGLTLWLFDGRPRASVAGQGLAAASMSHTPQQHSGIQSVSADTDSGGAHYSMDNTLVPEQFVFLLFSNLHFCIYNSQQHRGCCSLNISRTKTKPGTFLCSQSNEEL